MSSEKKKNQKNEEDENRFSGPPVKTDATRQVQRRACKEGRRKEAHEG